MKMSKSFVDKWLLIVVALYVAPIALSNIYYVDDMMRITTGDGWDADGRIFATVLMQLLSFGNVIPQMFPLSLFISSIITLISGVIVSRILFEKDNFLTKSCSLLILTSPFYLENLSYRYDSLPMSISILIAIIPFLSRSKYIFALTSIPCIVFCLGLYQTSAMVYFALLICIFINRADKGDFRFILTMSLVSVLCFIVAYFIYVGIVSSSELNVSRASFLSINSGFFVVIAGRIALYKNMYMELFQSNYILATMPLTISILIALITLSFKGIKHLLIKTSILTIAISLLLLLTTLPNLVINEPWYTARTMVCYPFIFYAIYLFCHDKVNNILLNASIVSLLFFSFVLINSYASTLKNNDDYSKFVAQSISSELIKKSNNTTYSALIIGEQRRSPRSHLQYKIFPILFRIAPIYMREDWNWGIKELSRYINVRSAKNANDIKIEYCSFDSISSTALYDIKYNGTVFVIDFSKKCE